MVLSKYDTKITKDFLLNSGENIIFERKGVFKPDGLIGFKPTKLANHIIGMLNADGGIIVLGISDGTIEDLSKLDPVQLNDFKQVIHDFITPPTTINIEEIILDEKLILIYHVNSDKERVFCRKDNESVYLRNGDETKKLDRDWVRKLEYDKSIRKFEEEKVYDFDENDFRHKVIDYYKNKINYEGDYRDLFVNRNLAIKKDGKYIYKNSAILLFSENPEKYISSASVRYVRYNGNKQESGANFNVIKDKRFEYCIPKIIEELKRFLQNVLKDYYYLNLDEGKFVKISEYPEAAWLEGIVNSLTHRSYNLQGNVVYIKHFDDRLEISNSGPLPSIVTVENIKETRFSRNPKIARVLSEMGYVRELREGVTRIYNAMKDSFLSEPKYIDKDDIVTLILKNNVSKSNETISAVVMGKIENMIRGLNETQKKILNYLVINNQSTIAEISKDIGVSDRTIKRYLNEFIDVGIIISDSLKLRNKNAKYSINNR